MMNQIELLLVEDNEGDVILLREAFEEKNMLKSFKSIKDGETALNFLWSEGAQHQLPNLIVLDINIPRINGIEVLKRIKEDEKLRLIPVIMLTTSSSKNDIQAAYSNYANAYITKPSDANMFQEMVDVIEDFWIKIVKLPN